MKNEFEYLLDPSEREHVVSVMREWLGAGNNAEASVSTIHRLIIRPLDWWIESQWPKQNTATDAATALRVAVWDMAYRFKNQQSVYQETINELDEKWKELQIAIGCGAVVCQERDAKSKRRWQISGGRARKGQFGPFRETIRRLVEALRTRDPQRILDEMRADCEGNSEVLDDLRGARTDPIVIRFLEVPDSTTDNARFIDFVNVLSGNEGSRTVKTLKNYLADPDVLPKSG